MQQQSIIQNQYQTLRHQQDAMLRELRAIRERLERDDAVREFEELARDGRKFAKAKGIKPSDVLNDD